MMRVLQSTSIDSLALESAARNRNGHHAEVP
jgi:hypothetical protein